MKSPWNRAAAARPIVLSAALIVALGGWCGEASAQRYKQDAVEAKLSPKGALARRYAKTGSGDAQEFRDYMEKYFFPSMTRATPEGLGDLEKLHADLFKSFLYEANGASQKYVHDKALEFAVRVLRDRGYHPSVRYNALLVLGKLDDKYAKGDEPPTPSARANDLLCALTAKAVNDPRAPRYELVGAMVGLERHAKFLSKLPPDQQKKTAKTLYTVLTIDDVAGEFSPGVRDWVFLRAASAASHLGALDRRGVFAGALAKRLADEELSLTNRAAIAANLAKLGAKPGQFDATPVADAVVRLAVAVAAEEAEVAEDFEELNLGSGQGFVAARGKAARRITLGLDREPKLIREGLLAVLVDVARAAKAAGDMSPEDKREGVALVASAFGDAIRVVGDKGNIDLEVTEAVRAMAAKVAPLGKPDAKEPLAAAE